MYAALFSMIEWNILVNNLPFVLFSVVPRVFLISLSKINQNLQNLRSLLQSLLLVNFLYKLLRCNYAKEIQRKCNAKEKRIMHLGVRGDIDWLLVFTVISKSIIGLLRPFGNENMKLFCFLFVSYYFDFKVPRVPRISPG